MSPLPPRFSIIMPTLCKRPEMLKKAVQAIIDQDFQDWELIIKNGNPHIQLSDLGISPDGRILFVEEDDNGIGQAMNQGIAQSIGQILNESNDDDIMAPGTLTLVDTEIGDAEWLYGNIKFSNGGLMGAPFDYEILKRGNFIPQPAVFFTRYAYNFAGPWEEKFHLAADYEYWLRLGKIYVPKYVDVILAFYTSHPGQLTATALEKQQLHANKVREKYL